jgi:phosphinothricin acetyltransferase
MKEILIRRAEQADLPALTAIYNHYIVHTPVTFDLEEKTLEQRQAWLDGFARTGRYQCFVAVKEDVPIGWASTGRFRDKAAYETSVETSVYLTPKAGGQGLGRLLYETLFTALKGEDIRCLLAGITLPNDASVALHKRMGFAPIGNFAEVGRKFGRYWDVTWFGRAAP